MAIADFSPHASAPLAAGNAAALGAASVLTSNINRLARRRNNQKMARAMVRSAFVGLSISSVLVFAYRFYLIDGPAWVPAAIIAVALLSGFALGRMQSGTSFVAAWDADRALGLHDEMASALSFVAPPIAVAAPARPLQPSRLARFTTRWRPAPPRAPLTAVPATALVPALVHSASGHSAALKPNQVYPLRFGTPEKLLVAAGVVFAGLVLMPNNAFFRSKEDQKLAKIMAVQGDQLVEVAKRIRHDDEAKPEAVKQLAKHLQQLGMQMMRGRMTKKVALTQMGELRQQLEKAEVNSQQSQSSSMAQIPEALKAAPMESEVGKRVQHDLQDNKWNEAAKELENLADKVDKNQLSQDEKQKTANDLDRTANELRALGGEANKQAADQLQSAASQLRQPQPPAPQPNAPSGSNSQNSGQQQQSQQGQPHGSQPGGSKSGSPHAGQQGLPGPQAGIPSPIGHPGMSHQGQQQPGQNQQNGQPGGSQQQQQSQNGSQGSQPGQSSSSQGAQPGQSGSSRGKHSQRFGGTKRLSQQGNASGAAGALRQMANGLRSGGTGAGAGDLHDMLNKIKEAEGQTGSNGSQQSGMGKESEGNPSAGQPGPTERVIPGKS